jgi:predicted nucleotidyltransferase
MKEYKKIAEELKEKVISKLSDELDSIVLYGSVARNETTRDSDIDVLIIAKTTDKRVYDSILRMSTDIDLDHNTLTSLVYLNRAEFEKYFKMNSPFINSVLKEGVVLYDNGTFRRICESVST